MNQLYIFFLLIQIFLRNQRNDSGGFPIFKVFERKTTRTLDQQQDRHLATPWKRIVKLVETSPFKKKTYYNLNEVPSRRENIKIYSIVFMMRGKSFGQTITIKVWFNNWLKNTSQVGGRNKRLNHFMDFYTLWNFFRDTIKMRVPRQKLVIFYTKTFANAYFFF